MSNTILLTGGTGFLGGHLAHRFLLRGDHVIFLARPQRSRSAHERVKALLDRVTHGNTDALPGSYDVWVGDVTDTALGQSRDVCDAWHGKIDQVWHAAAVLHFRDTYEEITQAININGTLHILNAAHALGIPRFHHISTAYVSGKTPGTVHESLDTQVYDFRNPYERTKYNAEQIVRQKTQEYGLETTIYRPAVIVGDSHSGETLTFNGFYNIAKIFILIKRLVSRRIKDNPEKFRRAGIYIEGDTLHFPLKFPCARHSTVNLVPIDYTVNTILKLADAPDSIGNTYHVTNPHPPRIVELLTEGSRMVQLEGIEFVDCPFDDALHVIREEVNEYAKLGLNISFCMEIREYIHYLFGEPHFDISNVRRTLHTTFEEPPRISRDFLRMLLFYAQQCHWKGALP